MMTTRTRRNPSVLLAAAAAVFLAGCESDDFVNDLFDDTEPPEETSLEPTYISGIEEIEIDYSPERRIIAELSPEDLALHARTVYAALDSSEPDAARLWESMQSGAEGLIVVTDTWRLNTEDGLVCRYFNDTVKFRGQTEKVADAACKRDGTWWWLRGDPGLAVLEGVPVSFDYYVIQSGGTLSDVANVTGVPEDELIRLNPTLQAASPREPKFGFPKLAPDKLRAVDALSIRRPQPSSAPFWLCLSGQQHVDRHTTRASIGPVDTHVCQQTHVDDQIVIVNP